MTDRAFGLVSSLKRVQLQSAGTSQCYTWCHLLTPTPIPMALRPASIRCTEERPGTTPQPAGYQHPATGQLACLGRPEGQVADRHDLQGGAQAQDQVSRCHLALRLLQLLLGQRALPVQHEVAQLAAAARLAACAPCGPEPHLHGPWQLERTVRACPAAGAVLRAKHGPGDRQSKMVWSLEQASHASSTICPVSDCQLVTAGARIGCRCVLADMGCQDDCESVGSTVSTSKSRMEVWWQRGQVSLKQLPCNSASWKSAVPERRCNPSTFWLTTYLTMPWRSSA